MMTWTIDRCAPADLPGVIALLDEEFVFSRKRTLSVADRYPRLFAPANAASTLAARDRTGALCGSVTVRRFDWRSAAHVKRGAMIGFVCTKPEFRKQGVATALMGAVARSLRDESVDFGVLWTGKPEFYRRLGWVTRDTGVFGDVVEGSTGPGPQTLIARKVSMDAAVAGRLAAYRLQAGGPGLVRAASDFQVIPLPAESVDVFLVEKESRLLGYAVTGRAGATGYLYEWLGEGDALPCLWAAVRASYAKLYANEQASTATHRWLQENETIAWNPQNLAMWLLFDPALSIETAGAWHVNYLDRV